jgi:hypothetical protein
MEQIYNAPHVKVKVVDVSVFRKNIQKKKSTIQELYNGQYHTVHCNENPLYVFLFWE